jgi:hypothetical protein
MLPSENGIRVPNFNETREASLAVIVPAIKNAITHQLMLQTLGKTEVVLPFSTQVFLMETHVAGTIYHDADEEAKSLKSGQQLVLKREPDNPHDDLAIEVLRQNGARLGYIPRNQNGVLARLMDAGKQICAEIRSCDVETPWTEIDIKVSMVEF